VGYRGAGVALGVLLATPGEAMRLPGDNGFMTRNEERLRERTMDDLLNEPVGDILDALRSATARNLLTGALEAICNERVESWINDR